MTEKLFYQDSSIKEFTATVESCMQGKDGMFEVILDQTGIFFRKEAVSMQIPESFLWEKKR